MKQTDRRVAKSIDAIKRAFTGLLCQQDFENISVMEINKTHQCCLKDVLPLLY